MKTETQIRAEIYNALKNDSALTSLIGSNGIMWLGRPTKENTFPLVTYSMIDSPSDYAFSNTRQSETVSVQIDTYVDTGKVNTLDSAIERIKAVMETLCYRKISSSPETLDSDINKIVKALRWEKINV